MTPMTPTIHKILMHGSSVIQHAILPIGQLSEEASEARNKHYSLHNSYARKISRQACHEDVINRLLLTCNPLFTSLIVQSKKETMPFLKVTINLLLPPENIITQLKTRTRTRTRTKTNLKKHFLVEDNSVICC